MMTTITTMVTVMAMITKRATEIPAAKGALLDFFPVDPETTAVEGGRYRGSVNHVYSGTTPLVWTPWGPGEMSSIERCPHFRVKCTLRKHIWDIAKSPYYRGVL